VGNLLSLMLQIGQFAGGGDTQPLLAAGGTSVEI